MAYLSGIQRQTAVARVGPQIDPLEEVEQLNAINRANRERMMPPGVPQPASPYAPRPGVPQPYQPPGFPQQPQPPR
jgi:hypothetical protein